MKAKPLQKKQKLNKELKKRPQGLFLTMRVYITLANLKIALDARNLGVFRKRRTSCTLIEKKLRSDKADEVILGFVTNWR